MASRKLVTLLNKVNLALELLNSTNDANNNYYMFVGSHIDRGSTSIPKINDNPNETLKISYQNMIMGKKITPSDIHIMIDFNEYESNTIIDMWDDQDEDFITKNYFSIVNASSYYHIYKCLDNNQNAYSTVTPDFSHISGGNTAVYETSDGYKWKYMYSVSSSNKTKYATSNLFPVIANSSVVEEAENGAIDIIKIDTEGAGYDNYFTGTFSTADLRISGNTLLYEVANSTAKLVNGFYTDTLLYISSGNGAGQYKTIIDYFTNSTGKYIVVNNAFTTMLRNGSQYEIYPRVHIVGDGFQTDNAIARALINSSSSNSVYKIEMINRGANYKFATANVIANSIVDVSTDAEIRPILSPYGGHGYSAERELLGNKIEFYSKFSNNESNTLLIDNNFSCYGIIKNPLFSNVLFQMTSVDGSFTTNEKVYSITPVRINSNATINTTSNQVSCNTAEFTTQVSVGDLLYFKSSTGTSHQLAYVNSIINATHITLNVNGYFSCTDTIIYQSNTSSSAYVYDVESSANCYFTNVTPTFATNDTIIGLTSGAKGVINTISINGINKGFDTFIQLHKYHGVYQSGTFTEDELIYQGSNDMIGYLHSVVDIGGGDINIYVSNQTGNATISALSNTIIGANSGAIMILENKYSPEIIYGSGEVIYIENTNEISRSNTQSETFKVIFEF